MLRAELAGGETYVLKLAPAGSVARERAWYGTFAAAHAPRACRLADVEAGDDVLVFAIDPAACDARAYALAHQRLPAAFGERIATALAALHVRDSGALPRARIASPRTWHASGDDERAALFVARCTAVYDALEPTAPIHADVRWENAIVAGEDGDDLALIDWEDAGLGAPAWDLGCLFASFVAYAVRAHVLFGAGPGADALDAVVRQHLHDAWEAYRARSSGLRDETFLRDAMRCLALRLGETALAPAVSGPSERERAALIDAALTALGDPRAAAAEYCIGVRVSNRRPAGWVR